MRVLLVNTNRMRPPIAPLALDYIGASLRAAGHELALLDLCLEADPETATRCSLSGAQPDLVALTFRNTDDCYFTSGCSFTGQLIEDVQLIKRLCSGYLVVGGGGFSLMPRRLLETSGANFGVTGDGEVALLRLLDAIDGRLEFSSVPGLVYNDRGSWHANAPWNGSPAELDIAARDVVQNRVYMRRGGQLGIETKRGCPSACIYCADPVIKGRLVRPRRPDQVVEELRGLLSQGLDTFHLCDSEFNIPAAHAQAVCRAIIAAGIGGRIRWYTYATPAGFTAEIGRLMQEAGCAGINFGVDSGVDALLAMLGRDFRCGQLADAAATCRRIGMLFMFDLLLGGPGETAETLAATIDLMRKLEPDRVGISLGLRIYPGTRLDGMLRRDELNRAGVTNRKTDLDPLFYISPALGPEPFAVLRQLVGKDQRFFLPSGGDQQDYNYNNNAVLERAIADGRRGAYWDILRQLAMEQSRVKH